MLHASKNNEIHIMLTLYILYFIMLVLALGLLALPFFKRKILLTKFFLLSLFFIVFTSGVFLFTGNTHGLSLWLNDGKKHYELLSQVKDLGGIEGLINQIKRKVIENPNDAQGWFILGKLYYSQHDRAEAIDALTRAKELDKNNVEIKKYLDLVKTSP